MGAIHEPISGDGPDMPAICAVDFPPFIRPMTHDLSRAAVNRTHWKLFEK